MLKFDCLQDKINPNNTMANTDLKLSLDITFGLLPFSVSVSPPPFLSLTHPSQIFSNYNKKKFTILLNDSADDDPNVSLPCLWPLIFLLTIGRAKADKLPTQQKPITTGPGYWGFQELSWWRRRARLKTAPTQLSADWSHAASAARAEEDFGGGKHVRPLRPVASLPPCTSSAGGRAGPPRAHAAGCLGTRLGFPVSSQRRKSLSSVKLPGTLTSKYFKEPTWI